MLKRLLGASCELRGGIHCDFGLKGCLLPGRLLFLKRYAMHRRLARASKSSLRLDLSGGAGTGA